MNVVGKFSLGLTAALVLNLGVRAAPAVPPPVLPVAADAATAPAVDSSQPYATIMARNVFGLVPIPPPPPPPGPPEDPPPKITANGIMSVFGELQALFKVSVPGKGGQPAKDQSYMLSEGQRQDDIEVTKIDEKAATITFDNHGTVQEIPLEAAKDSDSGAPAPGLGQPPPGGFNPGLPRFRPRPGMPPDGLNPANFNGGGPGAPMAPQNNNGANSGAIPGGANSASPNGYTVDNGADLTPEQQALLIETERARLQAAQDDGQKPEYPPEMLPPTRLTEGTGGGASGGLPP